MTTWRKVACCLATVAGLSFGTMAEGLPEGEEEYLVRITFTGGGGALQLSEVAVYDRNTNRLNQGLVMVGVNTPAADLKPGEFTFDKPTTFSSDAQTAEKLFDGDSGTKQCVKNSSVSYPISYTMRFGDLATLPRFYDLMTANDSVERSPTAWKVELSDDFGETWVEVDVRSGFAYPSTTYTWFAGKNNQGSRKDPASAAPFELNVDPFAPFRIEGTIPDQTYVEGQPATPLPTVIDVATGEEITDVALFFDVAYANNDKVGRATVTLTGREGTAYAGFGKTMVFNILPEGASEYFVRVTFKGGGNSSEFQISELAIYDATTNLLTGGLTEAAVGLSAAELAPGQFSISRAFNCTSSNFGMIFDSTLSTKVCASSTGGFSYSASNPFAITIRFADLLQVPKYYDLCTANDRTDRSPATWTVELSDDCGTTWFEVDAQSGFKYPSTTYTWFNGKNEQASSTVGPKSAAPFELDLSPLVPFVIAPIPPQTLVVGAACEPEPVVTLRKTGAALTPYDESTGTGDYTVEYANNTRPGVATLTVSGCGKYAGQTLSRSFIINDSYVVAPDAEEGGTGGSWTSPLTLAEALEAAAGGYVELWLKEGAYSLPAGVTVTNGLCIYGGFAGDETTREARHGTGLSVIDGGSSASVHGSDYLLTLVPTNAASFVFDRMEFRGAYIRALNLTTAAAAELTLEDCTVRSNGFYVAKGYSGRGLSVSGGAKAKLAIRGSRLSENRFWSRSDSNGLTDVCGLAVYLTGVAETTIEDTLFFHNGDEYASGYKGIAGRDWCYGWCISANSSPLTVKNTDFIANNGCIHSSGAIVQLAGAIGETSFTNCRFVGNSLESYEGKSTSTLGGALTLGSSSGTLAVDFCTFAYNTCVMENGSGFTQNSGTSTIRNSIFYANAYNGGCADIYVRGGSCTVENCRLSAEGPTSYRSVGGATLSVSGTILDDPRFPVSEEDFERDYLVGSGDVGTRALSSIHIYTAWKDPAMLLTGALDVHPKSEAGRWTAAGWVADETTSPLIDRGTADAPYDNEPEPKGFAANLGGYGNTTEASKTPDGIPAIADFSEDLERDPGSAAYSFTLTSDKPFVAKLWFCWGDSASGEAGTNGWEHVMSVSNEVGRGAEVFLPLAERGISFDNGQTFHWRFYAKAAYGDATKDGTTTITQEQEEIAPETTEPTADYETDVGSAILSFQLGGTGVYSADVYLCSGGTGGEGTNGWKEVVLAGRDVKKGASFTVPLDTYFDKGETAAWRIVVMIDGESAYERNGTVTGVYDLPEYKGKKGPKYVIHVRAAAEGDGSGKDWYNACTTLSRAFEVFLEDETKREIWVSGDLICPGKAMFQLTRSVALRGGFTTLDERSPEDRLPGARSKLSSVKTGANAYPQILGGDTLDDFAFDRFDCVNSGSIAGISMGAMTEGVKTLAVTDCRFASCPGALRLTGNSHARAVIANCTFTNCTYSSGPGAFQLTSCTEALVTNVSVRFCAMNYDTYGGNGWSRDDLTSGWAVGANDTPTRFVECEFVGNAYVVHKKDVIHAPVYVGGAVDGTEFVNCLFAANDGRAWEDKKQVPYGNSTGALAFNPSSSAARLGIRNCTFAYNGYNASEGAAGIYAVQGEVTIRNSIFFGNFHLDASAGNIRLGANATADIAWTMFDETNTLGVAEVTPGSVTYGRGICLGDPLFVTPYAAAQAQVVGLTNDTNLVTRDLSSRLTDAAVCGAFDLHLKGKYRDADGVTHRSGGVQSPAVNAGDKASAYDREPQPNGGRVNLGNYGNTPEATMSKIGSALIVR